MKTLQTTRGSLNFKETMLILLLHHTEDTPLSFFVNTTVTSTGEQICI